MPKLSPKVSHFLACLFGVLAALAFTTCCANPPKSVSPAELKAAQAAVDAFCRHEQDLSDNDRAFCDFYENAARSSYVEPSAGGASAKPAPDAGAGG